MIRSSACPSWSMAPFGADKVVSSFTDGISPPSWSQILKDKSKMARNFLDLWGPIAKGDILSWGGGLSFISSQRTNFACPFSTFSSTSVSCCVIASGTNAEECGPFSIAATIISFVHRLPVMAGQPFVAYCSSVAAAGWCNANPCGHMLPR